MAATARILALATADVAIPTLEVLADAGHELTIISRPAPYEGEENLPEELEGEKVAEWAKARGIAVHSPYDYASEKAQATLATISADFGVMVAFNDPFPHALADLVTGGWMKVHFSMLPKNRGQFPIRSTLWNGEKKTGVSVIDAAAEPADTGGIYEQEAVDIDPHESYAALAERIGEVGARLAKKVSATFARGKKPKAKPQNEKGATKTPQFSDRHRTAPWWKEATPVYDRLRALTPEPGMTTMIHRQKIRIMAGMPVDWVQAPIGDTGTFLGVRSGRLAVLCGSGTVFGISRVTVGTDPTVINGSDYARLQGLKAGDQFI